MRETLFNQLVDHLNQLVSVYRHLLDVVRKEKEILIKAHIAELTENNKAKETMVAKIRELEAQWVEVADQLFAEFGLKEDEQTLLDLAKCFDQERSDKLFQLHSVLSLHVKRTMELNKQNDEYIQSALSHISGAMTAIRKTLSQNTNYEKAGNRSAEKVETQGRLLSKEA